MLDPQKLAPAREQDREELFTERYERLLGWALLLTNQNRPSAEDLVQDAFIQFVLGRTSLEEIENIDGYLRRMLRYMHLSRMSRGAQKVFDRTISITDYDSFDQSWSAVEPARRIQTREELWQICAYACSRKETSRAGAVLILRFFHNYYPSEIAQVLRTSRHCVDQWQRIARSELKLFMTERGGLRLMSSKRSSEPRQTKPSDWNGDLIDELRQMIFNSRKGECPAIEQVQEFYQSTNRETLTTAELGHIVSCRHCLEAVNRLLDLPMLSERFQSEHDHSETPPQDKNGGSSAGGGPITPGDKYQKRLREVREHKPKELRIAVNGSLVSSLKVNSEKCELDLKLLELERVDFVEVFSEQEVQLLFLTVSEDATPKAPQWANVALSEGRTIEVCLRFDNGPTLQVIYNEPLFLEAVAQPPLRLVKDTISVVPTGATSVDLNSASWFSWAFRFARLQMSALFQAVKLDKNIANHLGLLGGELRTVRRPLWTRPEWLAALVSVVVVIGGALYLRINNTPSLTAANLLERASAGDTLAAGSIEQVTHRIINFEERRSEEIVSRRKIEIWQAFEGDRAERLYDENNRMIAGTWQKANGPRTVYHHGFRRHAETTPTRTENLLLKLDDIWRLELSAKEFGHLVAGGGDANLEEKADSYLITYEATRTIGASRLLKASLKLNRADLHPIEQAFLVERGGEVFEYRFVEASFERRSKKDVSASVFEPDPETSTDVGIVKPRAAETGTAALVPSSSPSLPVASAELEIDVAYLLNQGKGDRNEQVSLSRTTQGLLLVEGVVDTEQRKDELVRALAPLSNNPAVRIEIRAIDQAIQHQPQHLSGRVAIREQEETASTVAVHKELHDYLSRKDPSRQTDDGFDEAVRSFSSRMVNRSYRALFHAAELKRLIDRFASIDMRTVTPDARAKWLQMLHEHAGAFQRETGALRQDLQPVFFSGFPAVAVDDTQIEGDVDLARAVEQLHKLSLANNDVIRKAFTISAQSSNAVKSLEFWRSLSGAEKLAARVKQYSG